MKNPSGLDKPAKVTINDFIVKSCAMALRDVGVLMVCDVDARSELQLHQQHDASLQDHRHQRGCFSARWLDHSRVARRRQNGFVESQPADEAADQQEQGGEIAS